MKPQIFTLAANLSKLDATRRQCSGQHFVSLRELVRFMRAESYAAKTECSHADTSEDWHSWGAVSAAFMEVADALEALAPSEKV